MSFQDKLTFDQASATALSFVGEETKALEVFDRIFGSSRPPEKIESSGLIKKSALDLILQITKTKSIVMINEAHHAPQTRGLTLQLLQPLFDQGYRYLAAEDFSKDAMESTNNLGIPLQTTGFYSKDSVFGEIVREAKRIGFHLVAYEHTEKCDYSLTPNDCQNKREEGQARSLWEQIFKKDPAAKALIHAGYGHIGERGGDIHFPWKPMAQYFKEITGKDPLTIDQIEFSSRGRPEVENPSYRDFVRKWNITSPAILTTAAGSPWVWPSLQGHYDVQVFLPPLQELQGRPLSRITELKQKPIFLSLPSSCALKVCLIQAFKENEPPQLAIPSDQTLIEGQKTATLLLKKGTYHVRVTENANKLLTAYKIQVP